MSVEHANGGPRTPRFNHKPYEMRRRSSSKGITGVGDFTWRFVGGDQRVLVVAIPAVSRPGWLLSEWTINHRNESNAQWQWNGNEERPTLAPSLHAVGIWHGHVREGKLVEA